MTTLCLKPNKEASLIRQHPWVFSGALKHIPAGLEDGEVVQVVATDGRVLATGHYNDGSIAVRVLAFGETEINADFWQQRVAEAYQKRLSIPNLISADNDCYRLIHAEGDLLPGLIVDIYGNVAVLQCHSIGMHKTRKIVAAAIAEQVPQVKYVYDKSSSTLPKPYGLGCADGYLGEPQETFAGEVLEHGHRFRVNWKTGQKTGFFLDQRDNRQLLAHYAKGKSVLNTFCYSGGFSIYALAAGATEVHSVDVSAKAMQLTEENMALNPSHEGTHQPHTADVMTFLKTDAQQYDIVVVDPPAFAKNLRKRHNAVQGYKRLNALALQRVKPGGLLFTFSCSQVVDAALFQHTIVAAALESGRKANILHRLNQPADHPVNLYHPEGAYLKGLVLWVG